MRTFVIALCVALVAGSGAPVTCRSTAECTDPKFPVCVSDGQQMTCQVDRCALTQCSTPETCSPLDGQCNCGGQTCSPTSTCQDLAPGGATCVNTDPCKDVTCSNAAETCNANGQCDCGGKTCAAGETCTAGATGGATCQAPVDPCKDVTCAAPETCSNGACVCGQRACTGTDTCADLGGQVVCIPADPCKDVTCAIGGAETCNPTTATCDCGGKTCASGETCTADATGGATCQAPVDPCKDVTCNGAETCDPVRGSCSCDGTICANGETCTAGGLAGGAATCQSPVDPCKDVVCNGAETCNANGQCDCAGKTCATGETCTAGADPTSLATCQAPVDPCKDVTCAGAEQCDPIRGACMCGADASCQSPQTCVQEAGSAGGLMCKDPVNDPCKGVTCDGAQTCNPNTATCDCAGKTCATGETCTANAGTVGGAFCEAPVDLCRDVTCDGRELCDATDGKCKCNGKVCEAPATCGWNQNQVLACSAPDPCADVTCDNGNTCMNGKCVCGSSSSATECQAPNSCVRDGFTGTSSCTAPTGICDAAQCALPYTCDPATADPSNPCTCGGKVCASTEICTPNAAGTVGGASCVAADKCLFAQCGPNEECASADGMCYCAGRTCNFPETCQRMTDTAGNVELTCAGVDLCANKYCGANQACDKATGECSCGSGPACPSGTNCLPSADGVLTCGTVNLCADVQCAANEICREGACLCGTTACANGEECSFDNVAGSMPTCKPKQVDPCASVTCSKTNERCVAGKCMCGDLDTCPTDTTCRPATAGSTYNFFSCASTKCDNVQCGLGLLCNPNTGTCMCGGSNACTATQTCTTTGQCQDPAPTCADVQCPANHDCDAGKCSCGLRETCPTGTECLTSADAAGIGGSKYCGVAKLYCPADGAFMRTEAGASFSTHCPNGLDGAVTRHCNADGKWSEAVANCEFRACPKTQDGWPLTPNGDVATLPCADSTQTGGRTRECAQGTWGTIKDQCAATNTCTCIVTGSVCLDGVCTCPTGTLTSSDGCVKPPERCSPDGDWKGVLAGQYENLLCGTGMEGKKSRFCTADATWRDAENFCRPLPAVPCPADGSWFEQAPGSQQLGTCANGEDKKTRYCRATGKWDDEIDLCTKPADQTTTLVQTTTVSLTVRETTANIDPAAIRDEIVKALGGSASDVNVDNCKDNGDGTTSCDIAFTGADQTDKVTDLMNEVESIKAGNAPTSFASGDFLAEKATGAEPLGTDYSTWLSCPVAGSMVLVPPTIGSCDAVINGGPSNTGVTTEKDNTVVIAVVIVAILGTLGAVGAVMYCKGRKPAADGGMEMV